MTNEECEFNPELKLKKALNNIGDEMSVGQFVDKILTGMFIDYDGYCTFVVDKSDGKYEIINASYSIYEDKVYVRDEDDNVFSTDLLNFCYMHNIKKVLWYNK